MATHSIETNTLHALEDFRDAYDDEKAIVVTEAISNALDARATEVDITLRNQHVSFHDNGSGMNRKQFESYHNLAHSAKRKGSGIGFAGVGAKLYLAIWKNTTIHTETHGSDGPLASDMHVIHGQPKWSECSTDTSVGSGTLYRVRLRERDYSALDKGMRDMVLDAFNPALLDGLEVRINGSRLDPWTPRHEFQSSDTVRSKGLNFPVTLTITKDEDVPKKYRYIQYHVWGKTVNTKGVDWADDILEPYRNRVHVLVDAGECSKHLNLNKSSFKQGRGPASGMYRSVEAWVFKTLKENKYVSAPEGRVSQDTKMSRFFRDLFKNPKYAWLNPNSVRGMGPKNGGGGTGGGGTGGGGTGGGGTGGGSRGGGLRITLADRDGDPRDGWLDPETREFVCNTRHPLYLKHEKNAEARNLCVKSVLFTVLIKNGSKGRTMDVDDAFNTLRDVMAEAKDLKVV